MGINLNELNIYSGSYRTGSTPGLLATESIVGIWEVDTDDGESIQLRIPKQKLGTTNDRIGFYISASGEIGIGTKDPETSFDVRDNTEDADPSDRTAKTQIFKVTKTSQVFDVPVTASIISASSEIRTGVIYGSNGINFKVNNGKKFQFLKAPSTHAATIDANGNITASGAITASQFEGSNIGPIYDEYIYLTPTDFNNPVDKALIVTAGEIEDNGGSIADNNSRATYHAQKIIPKGYKATHVIVEGSSTSDNFGVFSSSYDIGTAGEAGGTTAVGTEVDITDIIGGSGVYCSVLWASRGNEKLYGGYIKLLKI